jgi:hypothetical protein
VTANSTKQPQGEGSSTQGKDFNAETEGKKKKRGRRTNKKKNKALALNDDTSEHLPQYNK